MKAKGDTSDLCWECTGSGWSIGEPCKVCRGTGKLTPKQIEEFNRPRLTKEEISKILNQKSE